LRALPAEVLSGELGVGSILQPGSLNGWFDFYRPSFPMDHKPLENWSLSDEIISILSF
jgi:hypothetical protein